MFEKKAALLEAKRMRELADHDLAELEDQMAETAAEQEITEHKAHELVRYSLLCVHNCFRTRKSRLYTSNLQTQGLNKIKLSLKQGKQNLPSSLCI